jgi:serine/threonine protein kinase
VHVTPEVLDPWCGDVPPRKIYLGNVYAMYDKSMTYATAHHPEYHKKVDMLSHRMGLFQQPWVRGITLREIRTCETLRLHPHPNICRYRGITSDEKKKVSSLVFDHYDMNLQEMVDEGHTIDMDKCLADVKKGIEHLQSLGFVHCDVKPDNIFVQLQTQRFVLGDFDATHRKGMSLTPNCGTPSWVPEDEKTQYVARSCIDWYSFDMLRAWLGEHCGGQRGQGHVPSQSHVPSPADDKDFQVQDPLPTCYASSDAMDTSW